MNEMKGRVYFPLYLVILYIVFTIFVYIISPWDFQTVNPILTYLLLISYIMAFAIGYRFYVKMGKERKQILINNHVLIYIIYCLLVINIMVLFIQIMRTNGFESINIEALMNKIVLGIRNPSSNYYEIQKVFSNGSSSLFMGRIGTLLIYVMRPLTYSVLVISAIYFNKLNVIGKLLSILNILLYLVKYLTMGTNKGVMDIVIIIFSTLLLTFFQGKLKIKKKTLIVALSFIISIGIFYFNINLGDRYFGQNWKNNYYLSNTVKLKEDPFIFKIMPEQTHTLIVSLSSYLGQGYYGFSLCTDVEWTPLVEGYSQNKVYSNAISDPDVQSKTLQYKTEVKYGWISGLSWSTLFSWIANSLGIYGVIFFMLIFGYIFAMAYRDSVDANNEFASIVFVYLMIEVFYISANNQISVSSDCEASFIFMVVLWLISRKVRIKYE